MTGFAGMRICLVGPLPPPAGGMANQTLQLAALLRCAQAKVRVVQTNAPYRPAWVGRLRGVRALFRLVSYLGVLWQAAGRSDLFHVMANSGWSWHLFAAPAIWIARLRKVPVVVNYRGGEAAAFLARSAALVKWSLSQVATVVVPTGFLAEVFGRYGIAVQVVPNIIDQLRFRPPETASTGGRMPGAHLLVARNLEPVYDNASALEAFARVLAQIPEARLTIAGSGPLEAALRDKAAQLGVQSRVTFTGMLDRDAMAALLRGSDIALNPSLADNMPNSVLEAMASGVPVVSTDVGGVPFMVDHERTGLLVPPRDPDAMAAAVLRVLNDAALRQSLCEAGRVEVQRYAWSSVGPQLALIYRAALGRAGH